jgi:uncharacterized protein with FMN-binding domain
MRRAVLTLSGTVAGLAALFSFKTHVPGVTPVAASSTPTGPSVSAPPSPTVSASASASPAKPVKKAAPKASSSPTKTAAPATTTPTTAPPSKAPASSAPPKAPPTKAPAKPSGTFTGPDENTSPYGEVQVQLTVANGKITAASDVQQPQDSIGANAVSQLSSEVLTAQSANIQAVSGATYTSNGYIASLQQAVDQAGL